MLLREPAPPLALRRRPHGRRAQQLLGGRVHPEFHSGGKLELRQREVRQQPPPPAEEAEEKGFGTAGVCLRLPLRVAVVDKILGFNYCVF